MTKENKLFDDLIPPGTNEIEKLLYDLRYVDLRAWSFNKYPDTKNGTIKVEIKIEYAPKVEVIKEGKTK